jgi:hypothetical protein
MGPARRTEARRLDTAITRTTERADDLRTEDQFNPRGHAEHAEHTARLRHVEAALQDLDRPPEPVPDAVRDRSINAITARLDRLRQPALDPLEPEHPAARPASRYRR